MTPAVADDTVCLATRSGVFCMVSATTLEVTASIATRTVEPIAAAAAIVDGRAYFADRKGTAVCVDLGSREVVWKRPLEAGKTVGVFDDPVVAGKTVLFFGKASLFGLSSADGTPVFAPVRSVAGPPCIVNGMAWFGSADGTAKALDPATGKTLVSIPLDGAVVGRPAASLNFIAFPLKNGNIAVVDATRAIGGLKQ
jgi:outer membrane protein assembly factor BamB